MILTKKAWLLLLTILFVGNALSAQQKFTIRGRITDAKTGEDLVGVTIFTDDHSAGTATNTYGFYSLTLSQGKYQINYSYLGYRTIRQEVILNGNLTINMPLDLEGTDLEEVVVRAEKRDQNLTSTDMGVEKLNMKHISKIPVLFGEKDVLKTIQLLPGISTASEGGSGFSVRGGSIDQNLILLDEATIYSASHLMGFFSIFNSDAIKDMTIYKGGIPANYGGRAASVLDISMREGNMKDFNASGGIGLISSRLTLEGPLNKDKASFMLAGRRSYADLMAKGAGIIDSGTDLYFYDVNAKLNYKINDNNRVFLSAYIGKDDFGVDDLGMDWGNTTATIRWNHLFSPKLFSNTTFIYSEYDYGFNLGDDGSMSSGINDWNFKEDFTWYVSPLNTLKFGLGAAYHTFNNGEFYFDDNTISDIVIPEKYALESGVYLTNHQKINTRLSADYGLRLGLFQQFGEGYNYTYDDNNEVVSEKYYGSGSVMSSYSSLEPRIALNYRVNKKTSLKVSYNRMVQFLHMLSNSTSGQPTDTWMPSTALVKPTKVNQYSLGFFRNFNENKYEFSIESYYKKMIKVSDYEDGTDVMLNEDIEAYILQGEGRSYGAEFYIKKKYGKLNGWLSYTLAKTEKRIDGINNGEWYNSTYDKTHDLSIVGSYEMSKRFSLSANWVYYTGNSVTFPTGSYTFDGKVYPYYTSRNKDRMPDYHRLDVAVHLNSKNKKRMQSSWDFSIYNLYNRKNAYTIEFRESSENSGETEAVKIYLFGMIPSVTWNFKF
jgi:hypothetical protein